DARLIDATLLTEAERNWLNNYDKQVYETLAPHLDAATGQWLSGACSVI
ncbi:unnamed protein product, partial [Laminaria digitata]